MFRILKDYFGSWLVIIVGKVGVKCWEYVGSYVCCLGEGWWWFGLYSGSSIGKISYMEIYWVKDFYIISFLISRSVDVRLVSIFSLCFFCCLKEVYRVLEF